MSVIDVLDLRQKLNFAQYIISQRDQEIQTLRTELASYRSREAEMGLLQDTLKTLHEFLDQLNAPEGHILDRVKALRKTPIK